jgi:phage-related protein
VTPESGHPLGVSWVFHAFQKKSKKGIETPKRDVDLIRKGYAEAQELAHEDKETSIN